MVLPLDNCATVLKIAEIFFTELDKFRGGQNVVFRSANRLANGCFVRFLHTSTIPFLDFYKTESLTTLRHFFSSFSLQDLEHTKALRHNESRNRQQETAIPFGSLYKVIIYENCSIEYHILTLKHQKTNLFGVSQKSQKYDQKALEHIAQKPLFLFVDNALSTKKGGNAFALPPRDPTILESSRKFN